MVNTFFDIETIPEQPEEEAKARIAATIEAPGTMSKAETIEDWHHGRGKYAGVKEAAIEKAYRDTSFDAAKGQICSIAFAVEGGAVWSESTSCGNDSILLRSFFAAVSNQAKSRPPFFIGHYVGGFDLKFLFRRAVILGIEPPFNLPFDGRHGQHFYDTSQAWCGFKDRISQDNLCKALGIEGKPGDIDGSKVWDAYKAGGIDRIEEYNRDDVEKNRVIYNRLNFIK